MSKLGDAVGLLGFDDSPSESDESEEARGPSDGQLAAAEDFSDAVASKEPKRILRTLQALLDLMD